MSLLELQDVHAHYGGIQALRGVSLSVSDGEVVALLGANGAGKTTLLRLVSGLVRSTAGAVVFGGEDITSLPSEQIVKRGLSHCPEGRQCFARMTVAENLDLGAYLRKDHRGVDADRRRVFDLFPALAERLSQKAGTMSGGEQQMLAIGRALMSRPRMLLLDEPSMGLAPILVERIYESIDEISGQGTAILLVEQSASHALDVAASAYVLETGRITISGHAVALRDDPEVQRAYLGA